MAARRYPRVSGSSAAKAQSRAAFAYISAGQLLPVNTVLPAIIGTAQEGQILSVSNGTWTNSPSSYAYQWKRDGAAISGSINSTRTLVTADVGHVITCTVTATNSKGSVSATSAATASIIAASTPVPVNSVAPAVTGTATVGSVLSTTNGTWTNSPTSYTYAWRRDGVDIAGATSATYTLTNSDAGHSVTARVYAANAGGTAGATSNAVAVGAVLRQMATRTGFFPDGFDATRFQTMSQSQHVARATVPGLAIVETGSYTGASGTNNAETPLPAAMTVHAAVSKTQTGPWTEFTWGSDGVMGLIQPGTNRQSDVITFALNSGDIFYIRRWRSMPNGTGIAYQADTIINTAIGDTLLRGVTVTDQTTANVALSLASNAGGSYPLGLVGYHGGKAVGILGDSRSYGRNDTTDATGEIGEICRSIGPSLPYINTARRTMSAAQFNASSTLRMAMMQYCTDVIVDQGANDFYNDGASVATAQASLTTLIGNIPSNVARVWQTTLSPITTGDFTTVEGQASTYDLKITPFNTWIKSRPIARVTGVFDIGTQQSVLKADGVTHVWPANASTDGLHGSQGILISLRDSGVVSAAAILAAA